MTTNFIQANPPTTAAAIDKFEVERHIKLPNSYRIFLLKTNGGIPEGTAFSITGLEAEPIGIIQVFMGIGVDGPTGELAYAYDLYRGGLPGKVLPIARNGSGDYVCLDMRLSPDRVAFWDKRHFWGTGEWRESDFYHVTDTFKEFLASLRSSPY